MAPRPQYERGFSFAAFEANQPKKPPPGQRIDIELDEIADRLARAGASAYELAVLRGFVGSEADYLASLRGADGSELTAAQLVEPGNPVGDLLDVANPDTSQRAPWETDANVSGRKNRNRWGDEIRITGDHIPLDYVTDVQPTLLPILRSAAALGKKVILPDTGNRYLPLNAPLTLLVGVQRSGGDNGVPITDSSGSNLRWNVRIEGNGCTFVPRFSGFAIDLYPTYSTSDNPSALGLNASQVDINHLKINLNGATGAQALRLGRQGRSFRALNEYSQINNLFVGQVGGANITPMSHGVRFEGDLYGVQASGWRLENKAGLWCVVDGSVPGSFQGAFFFTDFQAVGNQAFAPFRASVLAGTTGPVTEMRGIHFRNAQIYGSGTLLEASANGNLGDIWFGPGSQWDGPIGGPDGLPLAGEPAIRMQASSGAQIFNNYWITPYIQNYNAQALLLVTDGNANSRIMNQQLRGGNVSLINAPGVGIVDCEGLHSGGIDVQGVDFQGCTADRYLQAVNADSVIFNNNRSTDEFVKANTVAGCVVTAGSVKRATVLSNTLKASAGGTGYSGPVPTQASNVANNVFY